MKIAIFSDTFPSQINGVANAAYQLAKGLSERGHQVMVFTAIRKDAAQALRKENFKTVRIPSFPVPAYPGERCAIPFGIGFNRLRKFKPDVIHTHTPFGIGLAAVVWGKLLGIPVVGTHHTFYDYYLKHVKADYQWAKKLSWKYTVGYYNRCDLVISPSQSLADAMKDESLKRPIEVIANFIDTDFFRPAESVAAKNKVKTSFGVKGKSVIYMGRLSYEKDIDQVIKAFALAKRKLQDLKLMIVGDGPERANLEKLSRDEGIGGEVIFTGFKEGRNLVEALQANDIFLTASRSENMPLSLLEAMAVGLPFVVVKEKGLAEIVGQGVNGFFAKTGDPGDMAAKIMELLSQPELLRKLGAASRSRALADYSKESVMSRFEKAYNKVSSNKK